MSLTNSYATTLAIEILIAGVFVSGVNLLLGYTGLVPLGNAMFVGLGAYGYAVLTKLLDVPIWAAFPLAVLIVLLLSVIVGFICTRTREVEFLLITLAFCQMFYGLAVKSKPTGGTDGLTGLSRPDLGWLGVSADAPLVFYAYVAVVAAVMLFLLWRIVRSPFGSVLVGIRENERRVQAMGYGVTYYKVGAFVIAAVFAAVSGVLSAQYSYFVNPEMMTWQVGGEAVLMVIIGGRRYLFGGLVGAAIFILAKQGLSMLTENYLIFFGLFFMLVVVFLQDGVLGLLDSKQTSHRKDGKWWKTRLKSAA
ncbi:branched-chain amino acid ABC transporter permease [Variovorax sp. WS11]|nr:branched-chain amino acid ABC transporter permease [Variovorax sp. WS11]PSL79585.1 branched-chain amino acid ABC transporter permease [Variovorax sp. WS11]